LGITVALLGGDRSEQASLAIPLTCAVICFFIFVTDNLLCARQVRKIWRQSSAPSSRGVTPTTAASTYQRDTTARSPSWSDTNHGEPHPDGEGNGAKSLPAARVERAYYDKREIVGAGAAWQHLTLNVPLDKARATDGEKSPSATFNRPSIPRASA